MDVVLGNRQQVTRGPSGESFEYDVIVDLPGAAIIPPYDPGTPLGEPGAR